MARGKVVIPKVEGLIKRVYLNNPKWTAEEICNTVRSVLTTNKDYSELWPLPKNWPSLSKVQKVLAETKQRESKLSDEDKEQEESWDMSTLGKHPIPPESVPVVLDVSMQSQQPLTIREAKWIGRLYVLISAIASQQGKVPTIAFIELVAGYYATSERVNDLMAERVTPTIDKVLWEFLTKRESMDEVTKRGFNPGPDDDRWRVTKSGALSFMLTKEELARVNRIGEKLGHSRSFEDSIRDNLGITLEVKENKDERTSGQRQGTKAKRHRQHSTTEQR